MVRGEANGRLGGALYPSRRAPSSLLLNLLFLGFTTDYGVYIGHEDPFCELVKKGDRTGLHKLCSF